MFQERRRFKIVFIDGSDYQLEEVEHLYQPLENEDVYFIYAGEGYTYTEQWFFQIIKKVPEDKFPVIVTNQITLMQKCFIDGRNKDQDELWFWDIPNCKPVPLYEVYENIRVANNVMKMYMAHVFGNWSTQKLDNE